MTAKLIAIAGPQQGKTLELIEEEMTIGRDNSNWLYIFDSAVSRRHCVIRTEADQFKIIDLQSHNGTFVNDVPVQERILQEGDRIAIGDSLLLFIKQEKQNETAQDEAQFDEGFLIAKSTTELNVQDALYFHPEKLPAELPATGHLAHGFSGLLRFSNKINSISKLEELEQTLMDFLFEMVPAQRGIIILKEQNSEQLASGKSRDRSGMIPNFPVSRTILNRVLSERVAILSNDLSQEKEFHSKSLSASDIHSLLAVPLAVFDRVSGVIYLDTSELSAHFDENHLQLITAAAAISAIAIENLRNLEWLKNENWRLQAEINLDHSMIGETPLIHEVYEKIAKVAPVDTTVLIRGESGTGKELVARAIHQNSSRSHKSFVPINCAALPETLLESELFGYEKGAFSGAIAQKKGKLEMADGGTIFLDEIGELSSSLQSKLLRALQEREFDRVGGVRPIRIDVRFIAATNKNLEEAIREGNFRQDLYYRLNVVSITLPPLRDRKEDIPLLATYFASKHSKKSKRRVLGISSEARACLMNYDWPGNIRELENAIERAVVLGTLDFILPEDLPENIFDSQITKQPASFYDQVKEAKKQLISKALQTSKGNYTEAAKLLGVHPNNLHRLIRNLNLKAP
jgi:transcriptional regulator with GAF, ATPase, and Fis domain